MRLKKTKKENKPAASAASMDKEVEKQPNNGEIFNKSSTVDPLRYVCVMLLTRKLQGWQNTAKENPRKSIM